MTIEALSAEIAQRATAVHERMVAAAGRAGRDPADITLVAVTKTWPVETVLAAYAAGLRNFGENRAEELASKRAEFDAHLPQATAVWHQIGTLQSRKTGLVSGSADVFHALDRLKVANRLSRELLENGRVLPTFLEVNLSGEASKSGFNAENWESDATQRRALRSVVQTAGGLPGIALVGLMTMAPWDVPQDEIRSVFRRCRELAAWLQAELPDRTLTQLSMGMTDDFELAIEEGATHVRVGRALFGARHAL